jgi:hypothetical protein
VRKRSKFFPTVYVRHFHTTINIRRSKMCLERESNPHGLSVHLILSQTRIPIPPPRLVGTLPVCHLLRSLPAVALAITRNSLRDSPFGPLFKLLWPRSQDRIRTCMVAFREASSDNLRYLDHYPPPFLAASTTTGDAPILPPPDYIDPISAFSSHSGHDELPTVCSLAQSRTEISTVKGWRPNH